MAHSAGAPPVNLPHAFCSTSWSQPECAHLVRVIRGDDGAASAAGAPSAAGWALRFRPVMGALQAGRARSGACRAAKRRQPRREHVEAAAARARHGRVGRGRSGCLAWLLGTEAAAVEAAAAAAAQRVMRHAPVAAAAAPAAWQRVRGGAAAGGEARRRGSRRRAPQSCACDRRGIVRSRRLAWRRGGGQSCPDGRTSPRDFTSTLLVVVV